MSSFDPEKYKAKQAEQWSRGADTTWLSLKTKEITTTTPDFFLQNKNIPIEPGKYVLDMACGTGETTLKVAEKVAPQGGHVTAIDIAPKMLSILKSRTEQQNLSHCIDIHNCDAIEFPIPQDKGYDVVMSQYGVMFFPELSEIMKKVHKALNKEGVFACVVWGEKEQCPMFTAQSAVIPPPESPPGTPAPFGSRGRVEAALKDAGMEIIEVREFPVVFEFESSKDFIEKVSGINSWISEKIGEEGSSTWNKMSKYLQDNFSISGSTKLRFEQIAVGITAKKN